MGALAGFFILFAAIAGALVLTPETRLILGLTHGEFASFAFSGLVGLAVLASLPGLFRGRFGAALKSVAVWLAILVALVGIYSYRFEAGQFGERVMSELMPGRVTQSAGAEAVIRKRANGHFVVDVEIGGRRAPFLFDTGASSVVLRAEDAARFGIDTEILSFTIPVSTANGTTLSAETIVPRVSVGAIAARNVRVLIARRGALQENLLGMSFLEKLASYTVENNRLILRGK